MGVTLYSTRRGVINAALSPLVLFGLGVFGLIGKSPGPIAITLLVVGATLVLITLFDFPRRAVFGESGVQRVCFGRRHTIEWKSINALERARAGRRLRRRKNADKLPPRSSAGLVARVGKKRYLLVNTLESRAEFDQVEELVTEAAPHVRISAEPPGERRVPTTLYRRERKAR